MTWEPEVREIEERRALGLRMGGEELVAAQHADGKLTVRERIDLVLDEGSFEEHGRLAGTAIYAEDGTLEAFHPAGTVIGLGRVDGRRVVVSGSDFTARRAPAAGDRVRNKASYAEEMVLELKVPYIRLIDAFGASIRAVSTMKRTYLPEMGDWWMVHSMMGEVPVVAAALGAVAGAPAAQAAATHFTVMVRGESQIFAAGPPVVIRALGRDITKEELGGVDVHTRSGLADNEAATEEEALEQVRQFLSYLPPNVYEVPPVCPSSDPVDRRDEELISIIPKDRRRAYDSRRIVRLVMDEGSTFEMGKNYGGSVITMLARLDGHPVGVIANDPRIIGGSMDANAAEKFGKFVDLCNNFNVPIVNFVDQPGFMIGPAAEQAGTLKKGVRALAAIYDAVIPWATVVTRRAYGVAGAAHQNHNRHAFRIAWPSGEWGSIPIEGGVMAAYRRQIENAPDPEAERLRIENEFIAVRNPIRGSEAFNIEDLVDPRATRPMLCSWVRDAYERLPRLTGRKTHHMRP